MSERAYVVYIDDISKLDFEEFYNDFLNKREEEDEETFEELYVESYDNDPNKLKQNVKDLYELVLKKKAYVASDLYEDRHIIWKLCDYIATIGLPISVSDIGGWSPSIFIMTDQSLNEINEDELDERFDYMKNWALECGLKPKR